MMKIKTALLLLTPLVAFASGETQVVEHTAQAVEHIAGEEKGTDIFWRTINFLIFFSLLYYLLADKVKTFFKEREKGIADKLSAVQDKLKEAKLEKEQAQEKLKNSEVSAADLIESAKKEAALMVTKIEESAVQDKAQLEKSYHDRVEIETKKMKKDVVDEVLEEMFSADSANISNEDLLNIIKNKVA
jgi:F-type H+-transporting ATPase subunit b